MLKLKEANITTQNGKLIIVEFDFCIIASGSDYGSGVKPSPKDNENTLEGRI